MTPRERGGRSGSTSGYCWVVDRLTRLQRDGQTLAKPESRNTTHEVILPLRASLRHSNPHRSGQHQLGQRHRHQDQPAQPLQLVLAQARVGDPQPDDHERHRERP